jgi:hypothetical protein
MGLVEEDMPFRRAIALPIITLQLIAQSSTVNSSFLRSALTSIDN